MCYNRSAIDMQLAKTVIWVGCTVIPARIETVMLTMLDRYTVLTDECLLMFQRIVVTSLSALRGSLHLVFVR